ncbi:hypothetical protein NE237_030838 [Protea cynaroides]|uniref:Uncharacterized protein n=1 Tax=Protea cynaroides TaxID=273540 RepID=A0A9Q0GTS1_9MAGN|nr:hypothetical protein NE237_030838 [Protea cynaroides]
MIGHMIRLICNMGTQRSMVMVIDENFDKERTVQMNMSCYTKSPVSHRGPSGKAMIAGELITRSSIGDNKRQSFSHQLPTYSLGGTSEIQLRPGRNQDYAIKKSIHPTQTSAGMYGFDAGSAGQQTWVQIPDLPML